MKKNWLMMSVGFYLLIVYFQAKLYPVPALAVNPELTPVESQPTAPAKRETATETTGSREVLPAGDNLINNSNDQSNPTPEQSRKTRSSPTDFQLSVPSQDQSSNLTGRKAPATTDSLNFIIDPIPPKPEEPDALAKIFTWWSKNPFPMKLWYLSFLASITLFLTGRNSFRRPFLFITLVIFGFYLGNNPDPVSSIFAIPTQRGEKLIDSMVLVSVPVMLSLLFGRFFCGWTCPLGAVQEFLHPENISYQLPQTLDKIISCLKFIILIGAGFFSWLTIENIWSNYDPFTAFFTFKWPSIPVILLIIILVASLLIERPFCRYLCPLGAILSLTSRLSLLKMRPDSEACIACGKCSRPEVCQMNVISAFNPYTDVPTIRPAECIMCRRCAAVCRYSALKVSVRPGKQAKPISQTGIYLSRKYS